MRVNQEKTTFHKRVLPGFDTLSSEEKKSVLSAINSLKSFSLEQVLTSTIKKLNTEEPLYMLQATPNLRVIFRVSDDGGIEVLDLFNQDRLRIFSNNKS